MKETEAKTNRSHLDLREFAIAIDQKFAFTPSPIPRLKPEPQCDDNRRWEVIRSRGKALTNGTGALLKERAQRAPLPLLLYEDAVRRELSMDQGVDPYQTSNLLAP